MIKHRLCIILLVILSITTCASADQLISDQWTVTQRTPVVCSENGYYFLNGDYAYFYDANNMSPMLLCTRLECLHKAETNPEDCNACFWTASSIGFWENNLYSDAFEAGKIVITQAAPDGSFHTTWMTIPIGMDSVIMTNGFRGPYYIYQEEHTVIPEEVTNDMHFTTLRSIYAIDIRQPDKDPMLIEQWDSEEMALSLLQFSDPLLYGLTGQMNGKKTLWCWNLETNDKKAIYESSAICSYFSEPDKLYRMARGSGAVEINLKGHVEKDVLTLAAPYNTASIACDGLYFYCTMATEDDKFTRLLIASLQGVPLNEVTLPSSSRPMLFTNEAIFFTVADSGDLPCCMLRRDDMLMPDPSVILFQLPGIEGDYHN